MTTLKKIGQLAVALVLWALFALVALAGFALGVAAAALGRTDYAGRVFRAMDRMSAAVLDVGDGSKTVSAECGRSTCRFCRALCAVLDVILEPGHCRKESGQQV